MALAGTLGGWIMGVLAWGLAAGLSRDDGQGAEWEALGQPGALAVQGGMLVWGAYMGWRAVRVLEPLLGAVASGLLLTIVLVDLRVRRIPNPVLLALLAWGGLRMALLGRPAPEAALQGLGLGGGVFLLLSLLSRGAMGAGDVKFAAVLGAMVGYPLAVAALFLAIVFGGLGAVFLLVTRRAGRKEYMAYGPYLALGGWLVLMASMGFF